MMSRFFNVKDDDAANGPKIIWDEKINVLQPEIAEFLDQLRDGKEIVIPLKTLPSSVAAAAGASITDENNNDTKPTEGRFWSNVFRFIFSFIQCFFNFFGFVISVDVAASAAEKEVQEEKVMKFQPKEDYSDSWSSDMPLLEEHQEHLSDLWSTFKSNGIITGRRTLRRLSQSIRNDVFSLKKIKIGEKEYFILHHPYSFADDRNGTADPAKLAQVYETITQRLSQIPYTGYFYQTKKHRKFTYYYTSEIDAHWNSTKFEIKVLKDFGNRSPSPNVAYKTAIQCYFSDINECIFGFYTDSHITLKLYTCKELIEIAKNGRWNYTVGIQNFRTCSDQIVKFIKENRQRMLNKTVNIYKRKEKMEFVFQD